MKYMLLIYSPENAWTPEEWTQCTVDSTQVCQDLMAAGQFEGASPLQPVATANSVRIRQGQQLVTTGPFAETTEQLGGYFLIDVPNLDTAIAVAAKLPAAKKGTVEIRPLQPLEGLPAAGAASAARAEAPLSRYILLCYDDAEYWQQAGPVSLAAAQQAAAEVTQQLHARGQYLQASPLRPVSTATSVRIRNGRRLITDGPFAETREVLGGFYLILAADQNEAITIAAQHPGARYGTVEVRRLYDLPGLAESRSAI